MASPFLTTKIFAGSIIAGTTFCGTFLYWNEIRDFISLSTLTYLVQQVETLSSDNNSGSIDKLNCKTKKEENNIDLNCKLFNIPLDSKSFFDLNKLKNDDFKKTQNKSDMAAKNYYKLTFSSKIIDKHVDEIDIYSDNDHTNKIATLKLILKWDRGRAWGKTIHVLGKAKNTTTDASAQNTECLFNWKEKPFECKIFKFSTDTNETKIEDLNFTNLSEAANDDKFKEDNFYVVKIAAHNILDLLNMPIFKKETTTTTTNVKTPKNSPIVELHEVKPLFGNISEEKKCFFLAL